MASTDIHEAQIDRAKERALIERAATDLPGRRYQPGDEHGFDGAFRDPVTKLLVSGPAHKPQYAPSLVGVTLIFAIPGEDNMVVQRIGSGWHFSGGHGLFPRHIRLMGQIDEFAQAEREHAPKR